MMEPIKTRHVTRANQNSSPLICLRPENFGYMTYIKKKEVDGRRTRERARVSYVNNAEKERERKRISYEKK
jgi:hypothetical protein